MIRPGNSELATSATGNVALKAGLIIIATSWHKRLTDGQQVQHRRRKESESDSANRQHQWRPLHRAGHRPGLARRRTTGKYMLQQLEHINRGKHTAKEQNQGYRPIPLL